jgi:amidohydrolase
MKSMLSCCSFLSCVLLSGVGRCDDSIDDLIEKQLPSLLSIYKTLHANPELSHYEEKTSAITAGELKSLGCIVVDGIGKYSKPQWKGYGVAGVYKNGDGPVVLIRSELDALPVEEKTRLPYASKVRAWTEAGAQVPVMYACGHDLHLTAMIGTARVLTSHRDHWKGTLVFIGEPAEETLDGVRAMLADGLYQKVPRPDYVLALHCAGELEAGKIGVQFGPAYAASQVVEITVRGKGGHASRPHEGKDPVVVAAQIILALQTIVSRESPPTVPSVVTVGVIQGGLKANVIPDDVKLLVSVRALDTELRDRHVKSVERIAKGIALAAGIPEGLAPIVKASDTEVVPATFNDVSLTERIAESFKRALGPDQVATLKPRMAGDDFGYFADAGNKRNPLSIVSLGIADPQKVRESQISQIPLPPTHSPYFAPMAEPALRTGIKAMASGILDLLKK